MNNHEASKCAEIIEAVLSITDESAYDMLVNMKKNDNELFTALFGHLDDMSNPKNLVQKLAITHTADFMYIMKRCVDVSSLNEELQKIYVGSTTSAFENTISAIKFLRSKTGMSLREAKDYVFDLFSLN